MSAWSGVAANLASPDRALFLVVAVCWVGWTVLRPGDGRGHRTVDIGLGVLLTALLAWGLVPLPFEEDAPVIRAGIAATDVFADWNHPFLPYVFLRPATWVGFEPHVLRVVPFLFLVGEAGLLVGFAGARGGRLAAALSGVWFAAEVRRRHGLVELGDWDVAGTFLLALAWWVWTLPDDAPTPRAGWLAAGLLLAACFSSWLAIVPTGCLVGVVAWRARGAPSWRAFAGVLAVVWVLAAVAALRVLAWGVALRQGAMGGEGTAALFVDMLGESPLGRSPWMGLAMAVGAVWLVRDRASWASRWEGWAWIAVPASLLVAAATSRVHGGYYLDLWVPVMLSTAGVGAAWSLGFLGRWSRALAALAVVIATGSTPAWPDRSSVGAQHIATFERVTAASDAPILTANISLFRLLVHARLVDGRASPADLVRGTTPTDLFARMRPIDGHCAVVDGMAEPEGAYFLALQIGGPHPCPERVAAACTPVVEVPGDEGLRFYACDAGADARAD